MGMRGPEPDVQRYYRVLEWIRDFQGANGYCPSIYEIAEEFRLSRRGVTIALDYLEGRGAITRQPRIARSIVLL